MTDQLCATPLSEKQAKEVATWRYPDEYAIYDFPTWEEMLEDGWVITDPAVREREYLGFSDSEGNLLAFTRTTEKEDGFFLGIGVSPVRISKGVGTIALGEAVKRIRQLRGDARIYLEVRQWNARAIRCYEKAGFATTAIIEQETHAGKGVFCRMELQ